MATIDFFFFDEFLSTKVSFQVNLFHLDGDKAPLGMPAWLFIQEFAKIQKHLTIAIET